MRKFLQWLKKAKLDILAISSLLVVTGFVSIPNMANYPQRFEDEGTYVSQAWAVIEKGDLAHYTYWYDHPPAAWLQLAGWFGATGALDRYDSAITAGREFMIVMHFISVILLYILARRLTIARAAAFIGVLAFALSPLVIVFSRYVMLDNIALPWLLGAFVLALSPRRHFVTAIASAVCMAIAILSKETFAALLPVLMYALWQNSDKRNRRFTFTGFGIVLVMAGGLYLLFAILKGELFPAANQVSLLGTLQWQLFSREGSGSILDPSSHTRGLAEFWLTFDYRLLILGALATIPALFYRNLRIVAIAFLISLALLLRTGYLPYPYVIILLPFAALLFAGVLDRLVITPLRKTTYLRPAEISSFAIASVLALGLIVAAPDWIPKYTTALTTDNDAPSRQAVDWIAKNVGRDQQLVTESALWTDLQLRGFNQPEPIWLYKTETDPAVTKTLGDWRNIDYIALNGPTVGDASFGDTFPTTKRAIDNAKIVAEFGKDTEKVVIYKATRN